MSTGDEDEKLRDERLSADLEALRQSAPAPRADFADAVMRQVATRPLPRVSWWRRLFAERQVTVRVRPATWAIAAVAVGQRGLGALLRLQVILGEIDGDAIEPRRKSLLDVEAAERIERRQERLLRQIVGVGRVVDEAMDHGVHAAMVAIDQHAKGRALARQHRFHRASLDGARLRLVFSIGPDGCTTEGATRIHPVCMLSRDLREVYPRAGPLVQLGMRALRFGGFAYIVGILLLASCHNSGNNNNGGDGGVSCGPPGQTCNNDGDCCVGNCDTTSKSCILAGNGSLGSGGCVAAAGACTSSVQCCGLSCVSGACTGVCTQDGKACTSDAACCGGNCVSGTCQPIVAGSCSTDGNACSDSSTCCSKNCQGGTCITTGAGCQPISDVCFSGTDCCSGKCTIPSGKTAGTCTAIQTNGNCTMDGEPCPGCSSCCSRVCAGTLAKASVCQLAGGCRIQGDTCYKDGDCCGATGLHQDIVPGGHAGEMVVQGP